MSRITIPPTAARPIFGSRTAFDALQVESGEESEGEEQPSNSDGDAGQSSTSHEPPKPTKSAIKKAQKLARIEQKQRLKQQKAEAKKAESSNKLQSNGNDLHLPSPSVSEVSSVPDLKPSSLETPDSQPPKPVETTLPKVDDVTKVDSTAASESPLATSKITTESKPVVETQVLPPSSAPKSSAAEVPAPLKQTTTDTVAKENGTQKEAPVQDVEKVKKRQNALTRVVWTFIMIGGFIGLLLLGHAYMILLVLLCQTLVYREVTALFSLKSATPESRDVEGLKGKDPWSKTLNWYFFAVTNYFLYGESIIYYFKHVVFADANLLPFATNHRMISFTLYIIGFMGFVMSLKKGYLKQQFGLFCWVHMTLLLVVVSSHFIVNNILEGLIWFWVPASLVICNDCFAYIWGVTIGRTPLIKLSPKKTVEGFVGAFISTVIFAVAWGTYFMRFDYMICPVHDLGVSAWSSTHCTPNPVFVWRNLELGQPLSVLLSTLSRRTIKTIPYAPYQLHLLFLACFASLVAPFGGFFASGFKRAFNIKDFGHSIPGHGGMTDRMDCQFLMGVFTYVYYSSLIRVHTVTVGGVLQMIVSGLSVDQQLELLRDLTKYLEGQGISV